MSQSTLGAILRGQDTGQGRTIRRPVRRAFPGIRTILEAMESRLLPAVSIALDYSFDANGFFSSQARRDMMKLAADTMVASFSDSLAAIAPNPGAGNSWTAVFPDPVSGATRSLTNLAVPANTLIIYVGGGALPGLAEAGEGSTGGFSGSGNSAWLDTLSARGKAGALATPPTSFGPWGGSIRFDNSGGTNWYFGQRLAGLGPSQTDFLSIAEHEIGHVLGLGTSGSWDARVSGGFFNGPTAVAANGGLSVPVNATGDHWAQSVHSNGGQALMDPVLTNGTRALVTSLDIAALRDIGWQINQIPLPSLQFSAPGYSVNEAGGSIVVTVTRTGMPSAVNIAYATSNGTARAGVDYQATSGTLSFANGELNKTFSIPILNDHLADGNETVNLTLSSPTQGGVMGSPATATLTIIDAISIASGSKPQGDFDGDGRSDLVDFRPSSAAWNIQRSTAGLLTPSPVFGATGLADIPVMGDFDGVGHPQIAVFRPSTAQWIVHGSTGDHLLGTFGATNLFDIPVPGDYDGVGHAEMAVFRPSTAQWFVFGPNGSHLLGTFGATNLFDIPAPGDYDGTGKTEMAVFRPNTAQWFAFGPSGSHSLATFGATNLFDIPVPGDYDGTGKTELAVYRPSTSQWYALGPGGGHLVGSFGLPNYADIPVQASVGSLAKLGVTSRGSISARGAAAVRIIEPIVILGPVSHTSAANRGGLELKIAEAWMSVLEELHPA